jgi:propionate catabolism operon transcriptional regulator
MARLAQVSYEGLRDDCPELFTDEQDDGVDDLKTRLAKELKLNNGSRTLAAQKLGISLSTVWRWMKEPQGDGAEP